MITRSMHETESGRLHARHAKKNYSVYFTLGILCRRRAPARCRRGR